MSYRRKRSDLKREKRKMSGFDYMPKSSGLLPSSGLERRSICLPLLPKDMIFKILLCLPVDIIYNVMRFVCREWYDMINDPVFAVAHVQESSPGILIGMTGRPYSTLYVEMGKHGVEVTDVNLFPDGMSRFQLPGQFSQYQESRVALGSCNGLILVSNDELPDLLQIANLNSKQWINLPPKIGGPRPPMCFGLGYADSCKEYKVAYTFHPDVRGGDYYCAILSIGVDEAWRRISISNHISCRIPPKHQQSPLFAPTSFSIGGYIHWVTDTSPYIISLKLNTESIHVSDFPKECSTKHLVAISVEVMGKGKRVIRVRQPKRKYVLAMENHLCVMTVWKKYIWELWELVEVETSHWEKLFRINLSSQIPVIEKHFGGSYGFDLTPIGLLKNGELVMVHLLLPDHDNLFPGNGNIMIYNVKTGATDFLDTHLQLGNGFLRPCYHHVNSLVSLKRR